MPGYGSAATASGRDTASRRARRRPVWRTRPGLPRRPHRPAGVEDLDEFAKRVGAALQDDVDGAPGGTIVIATHGGSARHGAAQLLDWPGTVARTLRVLANCHWTELTFDAVRGWQLSAHNVG